MKRYFAQGLFLSIMFYASLATADMLIWRHDGSAITLFGQIEDQDAQTVRFRLHPESGGDLKVFPREDVLALVVNIDSERLGRLDLRNLTDYRDYAEELSSQSIDLQARDLAIRLFLIVGYWSNRLESESNATELRESALRNLPNLARSEKERIGFEKLAFLYQVVPQWPSQNPPETTLIDLDESRRSSLLRLLVAIRTENLTLARQLLRQPEIGQDWKRTVTSCSWGELNRILEKGGPSLLQREELLKVEVEILTGQKLIRRRQRANAWSVQAQNRDDRAELIPSFSNVTEFDPQQALYRDGHWTRIQPGQE